MKITKKLITEMIEEELQQEADKKKGFSQIKPWDSALVFFDKTLTGTPKIPGGMVRVKAAVDSGWTHNLKKNYQKNNIVLQITQDVIDLDGNIESAPYYININGKYVEPDEEGRFWDVANFILQRKGITDKYANLLDNQGNIVATKKQQNKWSGV